MDLACGIIHTMAGVLDFTIVPDGLILIIMVVDITMAAIGDPPCTGHLIIIVRVILLITGLHIIQNPDTDHPWQHTITEVEIIMLLSIIIFTEIIKASVPTTR